ncbi:hypothetical protein U9M48_039020 [Paspalum notatum var. saurae]|uniref:Cytochrome P450 n=1 Tax=Paspalum notatum var. saurae TaxID=547442 RepID=A0AAQ3XE59_PASNO
MLVAAFIYFSMKSKRNPLLPTDWPLVGMLPGIAASLLGHVTAAGKKSWYEFLTNALVASGHTLKVRGPMASSMNFFVTCDPMNIRHMYTLNFANYPKGEGFAEIFDTVEGSVMTSDGENWRWRRAMSRQALAQPELLTYLSRRWCDKVEEDLLPLLSHAAVTGTKINMEDLLGRLVFDLSTTLVFGVDPGSLSVDIPPTASPALDAIMEVAFFRHIMPASMWKAMRWLNVGPERKLAEAQRLIHGFVLDMIKKNKDRERGTAAPVDLLSFFTVNYPDDLSVDQTGEPNKLLHATLISSMIAGRDTVGTTLPWLFYNLAKNPHVVSAIRNKLAPIAAASCKQEDDETLMVFEAEETKPLVYLEAVMFESMRLYPPILYERKSALAEDVLPSGHQVRAGDVILISLYVMGRLDSVWGKDYCEYRPERWLSRDGSSLLYVPSHKFLAFNSGPRMCLGKEMAITQIKTIVAAVVWNYDIELVEGHAVEPKLSCSMQMKNGLMAVVKRREKGCNDENKLS